MAPTAIIKTDIKIKRKTNRYQESYSPINSNRKKKTEINTQT